MIDPNNIFICISEGCKVEKRIAIEP